MKASFLGRRVVLQAVLTALLLAAAIPGAHGSQGTPESLVVVRDDRGNEHRLARPPQRIVTMLPSLTEAVAVLGEDSRLVGVDRYSDWPESITQLPRLGGLEDARIEAIAALQPDLILASSSSRAMERLEVLGFTVVRLKSETYEDVRRTLDLVARLLGKPDEGARVWARLEREIEAAAAGVPASLRGQRVYFEIDGGPYAAGTTSFIGETLARLGLVNVVASELGPFPKLNPEYVVRARPDIILGERSELTKITSRPGWKAIPAVRNRRICAFDREQYEILVRSGPRMGEAAALLADCLVRLADTAAR